MTLSIGLYRVDDASACTLSRKIGVSEIPSFAATPSLFAAADGQLAQTWNKSKRAVDRAGKPSCCAPRTCGPFRSSLQGR